MSNYDTNFYAFWDRIMDLGFISNTQGTFEAAEEAWMESKMQERNRIISIIKEVAGLRCIGDELINKITEVNE